MRVPGSPTLTALLLVACSSPKPGNVLPDQADATFRDVDTDSKTSPDAHEDRVEPSDRDAAPEAPSDADASRSDVDDASSWNDAPDGDAGLDADATKTDGCAPCPTPGALRCVGNDGVEICSNTVVCASWVRVLNCKPSEKCFDGKCLDTCRSLAQASDGGPLPPSGVYPVSDGTRSYEAYCDMTLDGGGWTAFFVGKNGSPNVFGHFESGENCAAPASQCLRRVPTFVTTDFEFAAVCEQAAVKFKLPAAAVDFLQTGVPVSWQPLRDVVPLTQPNIFGSAGALFTGQNRWNQSFILTAASYDAVLNNGLVAGEMFASSYDLNNYFDECNGHPDTQSSLMLLYR